MTRTDLATLADQLRSALGPLLAGHQAAVYPRRDVGRVVVDLTPEAAAALAEALAGPEIARSIATARSCAPVYDFGSSTLAFRARSVSFGP